MKVTLRFEGVTKKMSKFNFYSARSKRLSKQDRELRKAGLFKQTRKNRNKYTQMMKKKH